MDVVSLSPLRAAAVVWQPRRGGHVLTVVCKATFNLLPVESQLAEEQERPNEHDKHWDNDDAKSLYSPADLVPFKVRADVVLVGYAYAPRKETVRSLTARIIVGDINKGIDVFAERAWLQDGSLREGARFTKMPLRYERAAGGPDTSNPVGMRLSATDMYGSIAVPNLRPPGSTVNGPKDTIIEPVGFGPVAASWPSRAAKLGHNASLFMSPSWSKQPLPDAFDPSFFNCAPPDQQIESLRDNERIILENLHPEHQRLVTSLPGLRPHAFVERRGALPEDLTMACDTLWIDTDRSVCTLTWRGQVALDHPAQPGRVLIAMERIGQRLQWSDVERQAGRPSYALSSEPASAADPARQGGLAALSGLAAPPPRLTTRPPSSADPVTLTDAAPNLKSTPPPPGRRPPAMAPLAPPAMAPLAPPPLRSEMPAPLPSPAIEPTPSAPPSPSANEAKTAGASKTPTRDVLQLVWFDPEFVGKIRDVKRWKPIFEDLAPKEERGGFNDEPPPPEPKEKKDRRDVFGVLTRAEPSDPEGLNESILDAISDDGSFTPPLVVFAGLLALPFDELETAKATVTAAAPLASSDKKLKDTIDAVSEVLKTPGLQSSSGAADGLTSRIKEAFTQANRTLPANYLDTNVERMLLAERHYQRRILFSQPFLRALLTHPLATTAIVAYLPDVMAKELPLFQALNVRVIAEVHPALDQYESSPTALRVVALARLLSFEPRRC